MSNEISGSSGSKFTITRALAELTLLNKRINDKINSTTFISIKYPGFAWRDHTLESKSSYQFTSIIWSVWYGS